jgi:hypothetical protein
LSVSTMLTLFLIPALYLMLEERFPRKPEPEMRLSDETGSAVERSVGLEEPVRS